MSTPAFLDALQARAVLAMWWSREFDTWEIARVLDVEEAQVCRVIQAARDVSLL